jgi:hypothetical protein
MPRIKSATPAEAAKYPREFSILVNLAKDGEAPREVGLALPARTVASVCAFASFSRHELNQA